jgi:archaellum component FlaF (FlaF/FlaG flagellin family)
MKITVKEILSIKSGQSMTYTLGSYRECDSAKSIAYKTAHTHPREDVSRYSVSINSATFQVTITALPKR